ECEMFIDLADRAGVAFTALSESSRQAIAARLDPGLVASNPLDAGGTGAAFAEQFEACFRALLADEGAALGVFVNDIRDGYYLSAGFDPPAAAADDATHEHT